MSSTVSTSIMGAFKLNLPRPLRLEEIPAVHLDGDEDDGEDGEDGNDGSSSSSPSGPAGDSRSSDSSNSSESSDANPNGRLLAFGKEIVYNTARGYTKVEQVVAVLV